MQNPPLNSRYSAFSYGRNGSFKQRNKLVPSNHQREDIQPNLATNSRSDSPPTVVAVRPQPRKLSNKHLPPPHRRYRPWAVTQKHRDSFDSNHQSPRGFSQRSLDPHNVRHSWQQTPREVTLEGDYSPRKKQRLDLIQEHETNLPFQVNEEPAVNHVSPRIKREPSPSPPPPIDIDNPPSLYQVLGLPNQTSGSYRAIVPVKCQPHAPNYRHEREQYLQKLKDEIRFVRGPGIPPLEIGNVYWRTDGLAIDWEAPLDQKISDQSLRSTQSNQRTGFLPRTHAEICLDREIIAPPTPLLTGYRDMIQAHAPDLRSGSASACVKEEVQEDVIPHEAPWLRAPSSDSLSQNTIIPEKALSTIAHAFLDRYFRCLESSPDLLEFGYTEDALMSFQFSDLPTQGICPRIGLPKKQSHLIVNYGEREESRNLMLDADKNSQNAAYDNRLQCSLSTGRESIISRLKGLERLTLCPSRFSPRSYNFDVITLHELGLVLIKCWGNLYWTESLVPQVVLRFNRTFLLRENNPMDPSWVDWPWQVQNDQNTLFFRPGVVCQCTP